jgi:ankyrin repeat protein
MVVEMLLKMDGIDLNQVDTTYGRTPLLWAAIYGHKEVVGMLLAMDGIDLNPVDPKSGQTLGAPGSNVRTQGNCAVTT